MSDELSRHCVYTLRDGEVSGGHGAALFLPDYTRPSRVSRAKASTWIIPEMKGKSAKPQLRKKGGNGVEKTFNDSAKEKPAKRREASQPASQSGRSRSA